MYDHQTESLWLQVRREAVTGPMTGARLKTYPSTITTWKKWQKRHPETDVLSLDTGHRRDYSRDPYESYYQSSQGLFSFLRPGPGAEAKALVAGVELNNAFRAYPLRLVRRKGEINDVLSGEKIQVRFDRATDQVTVTTVTGKPITPIITYWLVWQGVYPKTDIYAEQK